MSLMSIPVIKNDTILQICKDDFVDNVGFVYTLFVVTSYYPTYVCLFTFSKFLTVFEILWFEEKVMNNLREL